MRSRFGPLLIGVVGGVIGIALVLAIIHGWSDHRALHTVVEYLNQHAAVINALK